MKIKPPFSLKLVSQWFGQNANPLYASQGQKGHTGIDFAASHGTPILNTVDSYCYSTLNKDAPNPALYRAVYTVVDDEDFSYELSYGHCSAISAVPKTDYKQGDELGRIGNTGEVYQGGHHVTAEERLAGSTAGSHLHFQVRKLLRVPMTRAGKQYVYDDKGLFSRNGFLYEIVDYNNGYNGCVDPMQFFETFVFTKNLWFGTKSLDNIQLQMRLGVSPTDTNFGPKTLRAVLSYQKQNKIAPTGFVGPITRAALNASAVG